MNYVEEEYDEVKVEEYNESQEVNAISLANRETVLSQGAAPAPPPGSH